MRRQTSEGLRGARDRVQGFGLLRDRSRQGIEGTGRDDRRRSQGRHEEGRRLLGEEDARLGHQEASLLRHDPEVEGRIRVMRTAEIGVFGGSGFYAFLDDPEEIVVDTPYGKPAAAVTVGSIEERRVAFIPRHGKDHEFPPHRVPYRANVWAMKELGVTRLFGPSAAGSLRRDIPPRTFVVCDQAIDFTKSRANTFYDGPITTHVSFADPYCPVMRDVAVTCGREQGLSLHPRGTVVVIEGPRFSTRAESRFYSQQGWEIINMTQFPEALLARELEMCYAHVSLVTDYDVGVEGEIAAVNHEEVVR